MVVLDGAPTNVPRNCALGCLGLIVLSVVGVGVASFSANRKLEARRQAAAARVVALGEEAAALRSPLLQSGSGGPAAGDETNAVVDYNGLQWAMSQSDAKRVSQAWQRRRPTLPVDIEDVVAQIQGTKEFDYGLAVGLDEYLDPRIATPFKPSARAEFERFLPATRYVRAGVARGRCDWETRWEQGIEVEIPNLLQLRSAANILAYEATTQEPRAALETGLVILAFAEDVERQGTLIGSMISIALRSVGYRSLAHTMGRAGLEARDYQRILDVLGRQRWVSGSELIAREALSGEITILRHGGHPLEVGGDEESAEAVEVPAAVGLLKGLPFLQEREIAGYAHFMKRGAEIEALPASERPAAWDRLEQDLSESSYFFAKLATPNLRGVGRHQSESRALSDATRALAAAHLLRLRTGSFPARLSALTPLLGALPQDPHLPGQPLAYRLEGEILAIYSLGENGIDDAGAQGSDDRGFATQAPAGE